MLACVEHAEKTTARDYPADHTLCLPNNQILCGILSFASHAENFSFIMRKKDPMFAGPPLSHSQRWPTAKSVKAVQSGPALSRSRANTTSTVSRKRRYKEAFS